jgi:hypothetical protein
MKDNSQINLSLVKKEYILSLFVEEIKENHNIEEYIQNMDYKTQLALLIAKEHLGTSFDIEKCIGFNTKK